MAHNIAQINDGIDDQIADIQESIAAAGAEITRLQALIPELQADLSRLEAIKASVAQLSSNSVDININVNGGHVGSTSIPVHHTPNI
jgi:uncharacterized protein (DUF849 family)